MATFIMMPWVLLVVLPLLVNCAPVYVRLLPQDCYDIHRNGTKLSGVYTIYPKDDTAVQVYCDMSHSDGAYGGWTRRMDGSVNFYRPWDLYKNGFGNKSGEHWLGLENLYMITHRKVTELMVVLEDFDGMIVYAKYSSFLVDSEDDGYKLHVSGFLNGGAGDALTHSNEAMFTMYVRDHDQADKNCARLHLGAFWYNSCHYANPNGTYLAGQDDTHYAIGNVWYNWKGYSYGLKSIIMKIRPLRNEICYSMF